MAALTFTDVECGPGEEVSIGKAWRQIVPSVSPVSYLTSPQLHPNSTPRNRSTNQLVIVLIFATKVVDILGQENINIKEHKLRLR